MVRKTRVLFTFQNKHTVGLHETTQVEKVCILSEGIWDIVCHEDLGSGWYYQNVVNRVM